MLDIENGQNDLQFATRTTSVCVWDEILGMLQNDFGNRHVSTCIYVYIYISISQYMNVSIYVHIHIYIYVYQHIDDELMNYLIHELMS